MHNLGTVFGFEVIRTLKKKSFWIMALLFPVLMGVVFGIVFFSNQATEDAVKNMEKQSFSAVVMDESQLVSSDMITALGFQKTTDKTAAINQVKHGQVDAFLYYPPELKNGTEITRSGFTATTANLFLRTVFLHLTPQIFIWSLPAMIFMFT